MRPDLIAVGDVLVDVEVADVPVEGAKRHTQIALRAGGSAVNAALAAARHGASALVVGRVGDDAAASIVRDALAADGVAGRLAVDAGARTGTAVALGSGVVADPGASARLVAADIPPRLEAAAVLVSGYTLLQSETTAAGRAALERAHAPWVAVAVAAVSLARRHGLGGVLELARGANVLLADEEEAFALTGREPHAAARELALHVGLACVTHGARGAVAASGDAAWVASPARVRDGDGVGAGDAFAGILLAELARGHAVEDAVAAAVDAARG